MKIDRQSILLVLPQKRAISIAIFFFFWGFYLFTGHGIISSSDGIINFLTVRSLVETHSFALDLDCDAVQQYAQVGNDGQCYSKYDVGMAITSLPLYLVGRLFSGPAPPDYDALSLPRLFVSTLNQFVTAATCTIIYLIGFHLTGSCRRALELTFLYGLTTIAWPYATTYFSQPLIGLLLLTAFYQLLSRYNKLSVLLAGVTLGLALLTRIDAFPLVFLIGLYALYKFRQRMQSWREIIVSLSLLALPIVLSFVAILVLNQWRYGKLIHNTYASEGWTGDFWQGIYGLLFSPGRGIIFYSPLVLLGVPGLWMLWQKGLKSESGLIMGLILIQVMTYAFWWTWDGGWVWGPRFLVSTQPFLIIGLQPWLEKDRLRPMLVILAMLGFSIQLIGVTTSPLVYLTRTDFSYEQTLYNPAATPILGQMQDLFNRRVTLLIPSQAHGVLSKSQTLLWTGFCFVLLLVSGSLLKRNMSDTCEHQEISGRFE
jgi:hypothetical protein